MICKVFSFLGLAEKCIRKQVCTTQFVTCFCPGENRSRITYNALFGIVLRHNISMLHTFNHSKPMQPCTERHFPWFSSARRPNSRRKAKLLSTPASRPPAVRPRSTPVPDRTETLEPTPRTLSLQRRDRPADQQHYRQLSGEYPCGLRPTPQRE